MPEAWPRDAASRYIRNLRRSLPKGTSALRPLGVAMGTLCPRRHAEGKSVQSWIPKSQTRGTFSFSFMHLADAFIQSDLHCIQVTVSTFYQLLLSLGIEPMILALLTPCSTS